LNHPSISICIPGYNAERFIRTTVESCLQQRMAPCEILLSDDASTDGTWAIMESYGHFTGVRLCRPERHLGIGGHYQHLLSKTHGTHAVFLSCDDALHPDFVGAATSRLVREPELGLLAFGGFFCNSAMLPISRYGLSHPRQTMRPPKGFRYFSKCCSYLISGAVWNVELLKRIPLLPKDAGLTTDWFWALMQGAQSPVKISRRPRFYYRMHHANASHASGVRWREHAERMLQFIGEPGILRACLAHEAVAMQASLQAAPVADAAAEAKSLGVGWKGVIRRTLAELYPNHPQFLFPH
jgi:glycosyltransferase involved in cell wall biosynthesis